MAVQERASICLVFDRPDKHSTRSHHFYYIRMEREDQATVAEAIWLSGSQYIFQKLNTQRPSQLGFSHLHYYIGSDAYAGKSQPLCASKLSR